MPRRDILIAAAALSIAGAVAGQLARKERPQREHPKDAPRDLTTSRQIRRAEARKAAKAQRSK